MQTLKLGEACGPKGESIVDPGMVFYAVCVRVRLCVRVCTSMRAYVRTQKIQVIYLYLFRAVVWSA